ncbi:hypothetical protein GQ53DRAFT_197919 [Thozetella sp. PMI_491]|nr:hypothetical protein GQ53DRAFT_197919 [Thozetella sp. PMI_491]
MSVFSIIKKGHRAAKDHKAEQAEKERKAQATAPYKHVPKHAAIDALSGGPASYREADRARIVEQNRRRSAMTASGMGMSGMMTPVHSGMPRTNSSLSYVSYPSAYASPVVQMPRAYSYQSMNPGWSHQGGEMSYSPMDHPNIMTSKGKEVERVLTDSGRGSRSSSKGSSHRIPVEAPSSSKDGGVSPVGSSSGSTSSQDDLEMKPAMPASGTTPPRATRPTSEVPDYFHRLHPSSHARRTSDPAHNPNYYPPQARNPYPQNASRPGPPSRTNSNGTISNGVPPVPALPAMQFGPGLTTPVASSTTSSASSVTMVPAPSTTSPTARASAPAADSYTYAPATERPILPETTVQVVSPSTPERKSRRHSKTTKFTELETINSNLSEFSATLDFGFSSSKETAQLGRVPTAPSPTPSDAVPTSPEEAAHSKQQKKGKLSKSAPRSAPPPASQKAKKTNRWSLRSSSKTAAVAG